MKYKGEGRTPVAACTYFFTFLKSYFKISHIPLGKQTSDYFRTISVFTSNKLGIFSNLNWEQGGIAFHILKGFKWEIYSNSSFQKCFRSVMKIL